MVLFRKSNSRKISRQHNGFLKIIYLSKIGCIISVVQSLFALLSRPFMVYGYRCKSTNEFHKLTRISSSSTIGYPENLKISNRVWIWHNSVLDASGGLTIGEGCQIGSFVGIFSHSSHISIRLLGKKYTDFNISERIGYVQSGVTIGDYVFIGSSSIIYPGTNIGKGSIIMPGTHVKGEVPEFSLVSGNPHKVIMSVDNLDRMYLKNRMVQDNYFDDEYLETMLNKYNINKDG